MYKVTVTLPSIRFLKKEFDIPTTAWYGISTINVDCKVVELEECKIGFLLDCYPIDAEIDLKTRQFLYENGESYIDERMKRMSYVTKRLNGYEEYQYLEKFTRTKAFEKLGFQEKLAHIEKTKTARERWLG